MCTCVCTWVAGRITVRDRYHLVLRIGYRSLPAGRTGGHRTTKAHIRYRPAADHGGGILIRRRQRRTGTTPCEPRCPLRIPTERPYSLKGVGSYRARTERVRVSPGATAPATFAFHSMGGKYLTPSEYRRYVMRFHASRSHGRGVDGAAARNWKIRRGRRAASHPTLVLRVGPRGTTHRFDPTREVIHLSERQTATAAVYSSRCSIPCLETFASVMTWGIQSGLFSGASSSQAHPS
ncbi:hypothetical protein SY89_00575 [Halolamina pelagica]|uniref:Uncharacterized protein n=1 Tax=Halolamina pelagica TaxID=699431 RepID=A0A0P7GWE6_9EURY|nr:hypothetical protein SY89_00575 [Halolamina pelagica]